MPNKLSVKPLDRLSTALLSQRTAFRSLTASSNGKVPTCLEATVLQLLPPAPLIRIRGLSRAPPLKSHQQAETVSEIVDRVVFDVIDMLDDIVSEVGARFQ